jgi:hypothetical protein
MCPQGRKINNSGLPIDRSGLQRCNFVLSNPADNIEPARPRKLCAAPESGADWPNQRTFRIRDFRLRLRDSRLSTCFWHLLLAERTQCGIAVGSSPNLGGYSLPVFPYNLVLNWLKS